MIEYRREFIHFCVIKHREGKFMNKNRLKKTASILLAGIMSFGVFAFAGPVFNVNADEEYNFEHIEEWPWYSVNGIGIYQYATIDNVKWGAITSSNIEDFGGALPVQTETYDITHFIVTGDEPITLSHTLELTGESDITLDLNGHNLLAQAKILNLSGGAKYTITNRSSDIYILNGGYEPTTTEGGYFSVEGGSRLRIENVSIAGGKTSISQDAKGGCFYVGAGGTVNLDNVEVRSCVAPDGKGGALYVAGSGIATLNNVSFALNAQTTQYGAAIYCAPNSTLALTGSINAENNSSSKKGDLWFEDGSSIQISSTSNNFTLGCADFSKPYFGLFSNQGGTIEGITCADSSYELTEEGGSPHIALASIGDEEVTFKGANAIVNDEVNGTYYPLAFKLTLSAPASFQSSEYSYDVGYSYIKKNGQAATAHNGNVSFTDDEAYLVIGMNPALMTNDITWKVVKDGESVFSGAVNPLDCLKSYIKDDNESTQTIAKDLIVMGVYTEEYLYNTSTLRSEVISQNLISEDDLDLSGVTLQSTGYTKDWNSSEDNLLKYYGCSLVLNEYGLAMRQYVYYGEGQGLTTMYDTIFCTVNGVDYPSILNFTKETSKSMFYYAPVSNIKLSDLDKTNTFVFKYRIGQGTKFIDSGSIGYSVVDYMNMARNSKSTNTKLMNTLLSMYSLYNSCKAATQA